MIFELGICLSRKTTSGARDWWNYCSKNAEKTPLEKHFRGVPYLWTHFTKFLEKIASNQWNFKVLYGNPPVIFSNSTYLVFRIHLLKFYIDNPRYLKANIYLLTTFPFILKFMVFWSLEMSEKSSRFHLKDSTPFSCEAGKTEHHLLRLQFSHDII